jgi:hypothetical protein
MAEQKFTMNNWQRMAVINAIGEIPATVYSAYLGNKIISNLMFTDEESAMMGLSQVGSTIAWKKDRLVEFEFDGGEMQLMREGMKSYANYRASDWPNMQPLLDWLGVDYAKQG